MATRVVREASPNMSSTRRMRLLLTTSSALSGSFVSTPVACASLFFIGHDPPLQQQFAEAFSPDISIGQEPFLQQQSSLSQQEVFV